MSAIIKTKRRPGEFRAKQLFASKVELKIPQGTTENTTGHQLPSSSMLEVTTVSHVVFITFFVHAKCLLKSLRTLSMNCGIEICYNCHI